MRCNKDGLFPKHYKHLILQQVRNCMKIGSWDGDGCKAVCTGSYNCRRTKIISYSVLYKAWLILAVC